MNLIFLIDRVRPNVGPLVGFVSHAAYSGGDVVAFVVGATVEVLAVGALPPLFSSAGFDRSGLFVAVELVGSAE